MATYRRRRTTGSRSPSRKFVWARTAGGAIVTAPDGNQFNGYARDLLIDFKNAYGADILGATIMRIRGVVRWDTGAIAENETQQGAMGVRVYTEPNIQTAVGVRENPHADWMLYEPFLGNQLDDEHQYRTIDAKANRKLEELGQGLLLSFQHNTVGVAAGVAWNLSVGLKLP